MSRASDRGAAVGNFLRVAAQMNHIVTNVRGLEVDPHFAAHFRIWPEIVRLSTETDEFSRAAVQMYFSTFYAPFSVVGTDITASNMRASYLSQFENAHFLADYAREVIYLRHPSNAPKHAGLNYEMVYVVFSRDTGDAKKSKIAQAMAKARDNINRLREKMAFVVKQARIIVILFTDASREIFRVPATRLNARMSVETGDSRELLYDIAINKLVPRQMPLEMLTSAEREEIGVKYITIAEKEFAKLPRMYTDDAVAHYCGFIKGQIICSFRNNRNEGGKSYGFRLVWPRGVEAHKLGVIAAKGAGTDADYGDDEQAGESVAADTTDATAEPSTGGDQ
jgi:DNA-directed RNA polymerase subunit H (RpoH/RPB5)